MTSFAHVDYPTRHPGVVRAERVADSFRSVAGHLDGNRVLGSLVLAAIVAALLVVANQIVDNWTEGHLLAAWIVMWTVAFGALALLAAPLGRASTGLWLRVKRAAAKRRQAIEDEKLWRAALNDSRIMADISQAMSRAAAIRNLKTYY
jgi:hypothetical protein